MYTLQAFTSIITRKTPLTMKFNGNYFFLEQGLRICLLAQGLSILFRCFIFNQYLPTNQFVSKISPN